MGFDGGLKGIHYYPEPEGRFKSNFSCSSQNELIFKLLEWKSEGKVTHVDKLIDKMP